MCTIHSKYTWNGFTQDGVLFLKITFCKSHTTRTEVSKHESFDLSRPSSHFIPHTAAHARWPPLRTGGAPLDLWMKQKNALWSVMVGWSFPFKHELLTKGPWPGSNNSPAPAPSGPFRWSRGTFGGRAEFVPPVLVLLLRTGDEQQAYWLDFLSFKESVADHQEVEAERPSVYAGLLIQMERSPWVGGSQGFSSKRPQTTFQRV